MDKGQFKRLMVVFFWLSNVLCGITAIVLDGMGEDAFYFALLPGATVGYLALCMLKEIWDQTVKYVRGGSR